MSAIPLSNEQQFPDLVITDHIKWARMVARGVRRAYHFRMGSQEEQDLEATAYLALVQAARRFDRGRVPAGVDLNNAFRGWAVMSLRCACQREAMRLRNGGTYNTRRENERTLVIIERLTNSLHLIDPRSLEEDEGE